MNNKALVALIVGGPFAALAIGIAIMRTRPPDPPATPIAAGVASGANVVLITIDALRADHVGIYGSAGTLTPTIDTFAKEGVVFERTYAHVPSPLPSHRTLMTAVYPNRTAEAATLADALKARGYRTGAFVGSPDLNATAGLAAGFDRYDDTMTDGSSRDADDVFKAAFDWIVPAPGTGAPGTQAPFFVWIHLADPNAPYAPPEPARSENAAEPYDGEVTYVDGALNTFATALRRNGVLDTSLVVIAADYGESLGEHGEATHGALAYDATLRVPLIMWAKDRIKPGMFGRVMRLIDVAPTILDLIGAPPLANVDGRSVRPFIGREEAFDNPPSYFEADGIKGVVRGDDKLIVGPRPELYDLREDPGEQKNLYRADDPRVRALEDLLK